MLQSGAALLSLLAGGQPAEGQTKNQVRNVGRQPLPDVFSSHEATLIEVVHPPGASSAPHRHSGFVLGYVIEGSVRFQINSEPPKVLKAGEMFYEPPGSKHMVSQSADPEKPARLLAVIIAPKGSPPSMPL